MTVNKAQTEKGESSWNSIDSPLKEGNIREGFLAVEQGVNKAKGIGRAAKAARKQHSNIIPHPELNSQA